MGTRSITTVRSRWNGEGEFDLHATVYRHYDGYLSGHGAWLADFLKDLKVTNGKQLDDDENKYVNGPGRLAARLVSAMQADDLEPDLMPHGIDCGQEFLYQVDVEFGMDWDRKGIPVNVAVFDGPMEFFGNGGDQCTNKVFEGTVAEYCEFISKETASDKVG